MSEILVPQPDAAGDSGDYPVRYLTYLDDVVMLMLYPDAGGDRVRVMPDTPANREAAAATGYWDDSYRWHPPSK